MYESKQESSVMRAVEPEERYCAFLKGM